MLAAMILLAALGAPSARAGEADRANPGPENVDCWLLGEDRRAAAREQGLCGDAFARNSQPGQPPVLTVPAAPLPAAKPEPPPDKPRRVARTGSGSKATQRWSSSASSSQAMRSTRTGDFFTDFRNDFDSLMTLLGGQQGGRRGTADRGGGR
ncbi:hypothetical protein DEW08_16530 [Azospirillum thermophilum]|uniref:Uncharacterized protein n=1 Tax=Azospirillum thermophilum TaxID=2202148 RepID=A0A2S2CT04_9PROT|nr:hypothetical protein DEW08_16530 [Azospirillum thermophilum]